IGHTQAAAGVAGVIKMIEAMRHGIVPKSLHTETPSHHIDWESGAVSLIDAQRDWPAVHRPRRAAVSSFGISGTNAHVILEQPPLVPAPTARPEHATAVPWALSGKSAPALAAQGRRLAGHVAGHVAARGDLVDVGAALARRTAFPHRAVVVGRDRDALLDGLGLVAAGRGAIQAEAGTDRTPV